MCLPALIQKKVNAGAAQAPATKGIILLSEEEMREKRRRYLETIGAVLKNLENRMEAR